MIDLVPSGLSRKMAVAWRTSVEDLLTDGLLETNRSGGDPAVHSLSDLGTSVLRRAHDMMWEERMRR